MLDIGACASSKRNEVFPANDRLRDASRHNGRYPERLVTANEVVPLAPNRDHVRVALAMTSAGRRSPLGPVGMAAQFSDQRLITSGIWSFPKGSLGCLFGLPDLS